MDDRAAVAALIERIVVGARIPRRARRDDLRRELWTHFEEAGASPDDFREAMRRFGSDRPIVASMRRIYRWDYVCGCLARIGASIGASLAAALLIEVLVNLRVGAQAEVWRLAPGFSRGVGMSVAVVLALVAVLEGVRRPFNGWRAAMAFGGYAAVCLLVEVLFTIDVGAFVLAAMLAAIGHQCSRVQRHPLRVLALVAAFSAALYLDHQLLGVAFGLGRAIMAGAVLAAIWSSAVAIVEGVDRIFRSVFEPAQLEPL